MEDPLDQKCLNAALRMLGRRDHTRVELSRKLLQRGFDASRVASALNECERLRYLDDGRFCRICIAQQRRRGYGVLRIARTLKDKGVPAVQINAGLQADCDEMHQIEDCRRVLAKKRKLNSLEKGSQKERLYRFLLSRGFPRPVVHRVLEEEQ